MIPKDPTSPFDPEGALPPRQDLYPTVPVAAADSSRPATTEPEKARTLGKYELLGVLGKGAMGIVHKAWQPELGRAVALKVMRSDAATDDSLVERFERESRNAARLSHPNIVQVYEVGRAGVTPYFTMEYVEGDPLSAIMRREALRSHR